MPEVAGEAGILVDPDNLKEMAKALEMLAFQPQKRSELVEEGKKQVLKFSWQKCSKEMISVYAKVD